jgi:hypothetical protein
MRRSHLTALALTVAAVALTRSARAQAPAARPATDQTRGGDARRAGESGAQLLAAVEDAGATAMALEGGQVGNVRLVSTTDLLDATGRARLQQALSRHASDIARLRRIAGAAPAVKSALDAANVAPDRVVGIAVASGGVTVYHQAP